MSAYPSSYAPSGSRSLLVSFPASSLLTSASIVFTVDPIFVGLTSELYGNLVRALNPELHATFSYRCCSLSAGGPSVSRPPLKSRTQHQACHAPYYLLHRYRSSSPSQLLRAAVLSSAKVARASFRSPFRAPYKADWCTSARITCNHLMAIYISCRLPRQFI